MLKAKEEKIMYSKVPEDAGKCPEISTIFALKRAHLPRIMHIGTMFPGKAAPHQVYCS
jgi:hypothetical protein